MYWHVALMFQITFGAINNPKRFVFLAQYTLFMFKTEEVKNKK